MKKNKLFMYALIFLAGIFTLNINAKADEEYAAKIEDTMYVTLDEAVVAAQDGETIELLKDATTEGLNLNKNLTITSESDSHYTITFTKYGIALWGKNLTFKDVDVVMTGINSTPYTAEWNWMTICASKDASLTLENVNMTMDGEGTGNIHAIYFCSNNILNLTNSVLTIKNYTQDALEWDGGNGGYNVNIINSIFVSDHNRSGFTGTFTATIDNSKVDVINSTGNGSNGSNFRIINNSVVNFNNNVAHGLSTSNLIIDNSYVEAKYNGGNGVHVNGLLDVRNSSTIIIEENECAISSKWTFPGALLLTSNNTHDIDSTSIVTIKNNYGSGISLVNGSLNIADGATVTITDNIAYKLGFGGGIYIANGKEAILSSNIELYNNHAVNAGDDIYNLGVITFPDTRDEWSLNNGISFDFNAKYDDSEYSYDHEECEHKINGWYDDSENNRWEAHGVTEEEDHIVLVESGTYSEAFAIKAAHDKIKGEVISKYLDTDGNVLANEEKTTDIVGKEYTTNAKDIEGYKLILVDGKESGKYIDGTIYVIYYYDKNIGTGNIEELPPQTGMPVNSINNLQNIEIILYKKED